MTKVKKFAVVSLAVVLIGAMSVTAFAASYKTPAQIVAGLTGQSVDSVIEERAASGKTYGAMADDAGVLTQFRAQVLELRKAALEERVAAGTMTQERASAIIAAMEQNQQNCDGTCAGGPGEGLGAGFGGGMGRQGQGQGQNGMGRGQGTCTGVGRAG